MCGICGIIGTSAVHPDNQDIVRLMMDTLSHRGPDGEGLMSGKQFVFGHKRLSIIDLEHGAQPMQSEDGRVTIVYNGEIYNYLELREELIRRGVKFNTFSDTEVLLRLYEAHGTSCIQKLNGMFAFALYDEREELFLAARDHFGIKPFYYIPLPDGGLLFASEIKALLKHPQVRSILDGEALNQYLTFQFCLGEKTLFHDILKLLPASYLVWKRGEKKVRIRKYWEPSYNIDTHHTEEYFAAKLFHLMQDSIRMQLRSDVPIGSYLSGGIDSSSVVAFASSQYGNGLKCFTGKFDEHPAYDESRYARVVTKENRCDYFEVIPTAQDFIEMLPKLIYHMDEPAAGPGLFPQFKVSKLAREHVTVVLGGQGGDEIFGGYARYLVAYLEQCLKGAIFETQEEGQHIVTLDSIIPNLSLLKQYVPLLKSFWSDGVFDSMDARYFRLIDRSHDLKQLLHPEFQLGYDREAIFEEFRSIFNHPETKSYLNRMLNFDQQTLLPALLQVEDRASMSVSLESRVPLLDLRIVELMASIPPTMKFKEGKTKYILRKAISSFLPDTVMNRKDKMGFPVPLKEWCRGPLKEFVFDTLLSKRCVERGIFDSGSFEAVIQNEVWYDRQIWGALCLEIWHQTFIDNQIQHRPADEEYRTLYVTDSDRSSRHKVAGLHS